MSTVAEKKPESVTAEKSALDIAIEENERLKKELAGSKQVEFDANGAIRSATLDGLWRLAQFYALAELVPPQFQNKPANCFVAMQMAQQCRCNALAFLQQCYIVKGRLGIQSQLAIALLNASGKTIGPIQYKMTAPDTDAQSCVAFAQDAATKDIVTGPPITWQIVTASRWDQAKSGQPSNWVTMRDLMFRYRAAMFLCRAHYADVLLGIRTVDELEDTAVAEFLRSPAETANPFSLKEVE